MGDFCGTGGQSEKWKWLVQPRQAKDDCARKAYFASGTISF
ncbi:hypothetical protein QUF49_05245 [Fictibacillus sp. b24]|nr:hypothetical protein [Fictibacillus sp. b24]MDM5315392.1 hypothetical protein [Fictibacillus sp. b24]